MVQKRCNFGAFTLIELLVVVAVIALLISILLPSIQSAKETAKSAQCLSNLRQLNIAATNYTNTNGDQYPLAYFRNPAKPSEIKGWDFTATKDWSKKPPKVVYTPGILWQGATALDVHQCPSFRCDPNDPYTGYNYNTSYIGHGDPDPTDCTRIVPPARVSEVQRPEQCVIFGDGEYFGGPDKFMRSPFFTPLDEFANRSAGTQGYRHLGKTNAAFCDGHAVTWMQRYTKTVSPEEEASITPNTGFLSPDNSLYDLE